jgi:hypothetical protein
MVKLSRTVTHSAEFNHTPVYQNLAQSFCRLINSSTKDG